MAGGRERSHAFSGWSYAVPCIASLQSTYKLNINQKDLVQLMLRMLLQL